MDTTLPPHRPPDLAAVKTRQQGAWSSGDYAVVGTTLQIVGEQLCEALDMRAGQKVLDVAAGNGNVSLAAARRWCEVTSTDYVPSLLERGRQARRGRGHDDRLPAGRRRGPAVRRQVVRRRRLDLRRDVHARPGAAAAEMVRVCKPGGKIGLANWTPDGFIGQLFKTLGKHVAPPAGVKSPALWGTRARSTSCSRARRAIGTEQRAFVFRYRSAQHFLDVFRTYYGPVLKAFAALQPAAQAALETRHHRPDRPVQPLRRRHHGGAERLS